MGKEYRLHLPVEECLPFPIVFPDLPLPQIISGGDSEPVLFETLFPLLLDHAERADRLKRRLNAESIKVSCEIELPVGSFLRMIAKVAHSSAVAAFGPGSFAPLLQSMIRG